MPRRHEAIHELPDLHESLQIYEFPHIHEHPDFFDIPENCYSLIHSAAMRAVIFYVSLTLVCRLPFSATYFSETIAPCEPCDLRLPNVPNVQMVPSLPNVPSVPTLPNL